jgi:hypothetical protein
VGGKGSTGKCGVVILRTRSGEGWTVAFPHSKASFVGPIFRPAGRASGCCRTQRNINSAAANYVSAVDLSLQVRRGAASFRALVASSRIMGPIDERRF